MSRWIRTLNLSSSCKPPRQGFVLKAKYMDFLLEAEQWLDAAKQEARRIRQEAQEHFASEKKRGFQLGLDEAQQEMVGEMTQLAAQKKHFLQASERELVDVVMSSVRKIIHDMDDETRVVGVVKNALNLLRHQKELRLSVSTSMIHAVRTRLNELLALYPAVSYIDLVADGRLDTDECVLESSIGRVEAKIEPQLQALRQAFEFQYALDHPSDQSSDSD